MSPEAEATIFGALRLISPITHSEAVDVLRSRFGFRVVRDEGLQTEMRKGAIHVVVRTYRKSGGTVIRLHEDRFGEGGRHTVERSARLVRLWAELREALKEKEPAGLKSEKVPEVEAPGLLDRCRFYDICGEARMDRLYCRSSTYSSLCEIYERFMEESKKGRCLEAGRGGGGEEEDALCLHLSSGLSCGGG